LTLVSLLLSFAFLGPFALLAESGGKNARPDLLLPMFITLGAIALGVRHEATRPVFVCILMLCTAALGLTPIALSFFVHYGVEWPTFLGIPL
jgi:hypothetical protein